MIVYDIIIIGGGAAGMMAAARCADSAVKVALIEKKRQCGSKILITGKGRCNITNFAAADEFLTHIHPDSSFFKTAFYDFSNHKVISFFEEIGVKTIVERGGRVFPASGQSREVRDRLVEYIESKNNITVYRDTEVLGVRKCDDTFYIDAIVPGKAVDFSSKKVIISTGGLSYPLTGSTGDGYRFASNLGHEIADTFPSLTALKPEYHDKRLEGTTLKNVKLDLTVNGKIVQSEFGEVAFTDGGIEGALGFRVSRKAVKAIDSGQKVEVVIDLKPAVTAEQLSGRITREIADMGASAKKGNEKDVLKKILRGMLPEAVIAPFIDSVNLFSDTKLTVSNLPLRLKQWRFAITGHVGYERAVITAGGVSLDDISRKTMESKRVPGLYFAGEVIDLDADTGGYNLQIAFSTGALASSSAMKAILSSIQK